MLIITILTILELFTLETHHRKLEGALTLVLQMLGYSHLNVPLIDANQIAQISTSHLKIHLHSLQQISQEKLNLVLECCQDSSDMMISDLDLMMKMFALFIKPWE